MLFVISSLVLLRVQDAGLPRTTKTDGQTLLAKTSNIPLSDVIDQLTGNDQSKSSVSGVGFAVVVDSNSGADQLPINKFFAPGRVFAIRVKHSAFPGELAST